MISILGCGWFGMPMARTLIQNGHQVKGSTTSTERLAELKAAGVSPYLIDLSNEMLPVNESFFKCETLIVAFPPKLRSGDPNDHIKKVQRLRDLIKAHSIPKVIYISSTGVYPDDRTTVNENSMIAPTTAYINALFEAENILRDLPATQVAIVRFGGLIGPGRHPGKFFAGKTNIPNGQAPVNLIHLNDCIGVVKAIMTSDAFGHIFNACVPHHPQKQILYTQATQHANLSKPQFIDELNEWKVVQSVNVPGLLKYQFKINDLNKVFDHDDAF